MSERENRGKEGPENIKDFQSDTEHGYLEGYEGREFEESPERPADFADTGDWGRQGEWGAFSNRPGWKRNRNWSYAADIGQDKPQSVPNKD